MARQVIFRVPTPASRPVAEPRLRLLLLVLASSVLLPLALPSEFFGATIRLLGLTPDESFFWGNAVLGFVCIAPVFYAVSRAPTFGFASILGLIFGGVSTALANYWLMFFQGYTIWTMGGTVLGYMGYNALLFPFLRGVRGSAAGFVPSCLPQPGACTSTSSPSVSLAIPGGLSGIPPERFSHSSSSSTSPGSGDSPSSWRLSTR